MNDDNEPTAPAAAPEQQPTGQLPAPAPASASRAPEGQADMPPLPELTARDGFADRPAEDAAAPASDEALTQSYRTVPFNDGDLRPFAAQDGEPSPAPAGAAAWYGTPAPGPSAATAPQGPAPQGPTPQGPAPQGPTPQGPATPAGPRRPGGPNGATMYRPANGAHRRTPWAAVIATAAAVSLLFGALGAWGANWLLAAPDQAPSAAAPDNSASADAASSEDAPTPGDWTAVAAHVENSVVAIQTSGTAPDGSAKSAEGSGVVWDDTGHIVTNHHVIADAASSGQIAVLAGNRLIPASIVGSDAATDLAVLKIEDTTGLEPINRADSEQLVVGQQVAAIGNPLGLSGSVTTGIISAVDRPVATGGSQQAPVITNAIQTSAPLNPGNSGGALVNDTGSLIGINSAIATIGGTGGQQSGNIGIGFAIPVNLADHIVGQLIEKGKVDHAFLGTTTTDGTAQSASGQVLGAEVKTVVDGGPAAAAGLQPGDLIIKVNGLTVTGSQHLVGTVRTLSAGDTAKVTVIRDGKELTLDVVLGVSPNL